VNSARISSAVAVCLLSTQAVLLAWSSSCHSPVSDEASHLAAGVFIWHFGRFDLYQVNPPLVRTLAAIPVVFSRPKTDWRNYNLQPGKRPEFHVGADFIRANPPEDIYWHFLLARWAIIPLVLLGGGICWLWASQLYGRLSGLLANSSCNFALQRF